MHADTVAATVVRDEAIARRLATFCLNAAQKPAPTGLGHSHSTDTAIRESSAAKIRAGTVATSAKARAIAR